MKLSHVFLVLSLLALPATALGQTPPVNRVLIRNVQVEDAAGARPRTVDVLIVDGAISLATVGASAVPGTTIIDGEGNRLTVAANGEIRLRPITSYSVGPPTAGDQTAPFSPRIYTNAVARTSPVRRDPADEAVGGSIGPAPQTAPQEDGNLAQKVTDPTAPLTTVTFQNKFSPSLWGIDDKQNEFDVQLAIPLKFLGRQNILRATIPFTTSSPTGNRGLGDVALFDIMLFPQKWGTPIVGVVASFGVNKGPGEDTFAVGPAFGAVFKHKRWTYGVFNQNLFSGDDIALTQIQPILAYTVNPKVSIAFGDQQFSYDWSRRRFVLVPLGFQLNYIARFGKQPVRFFVGPQYNLKNEFGSRKWTITAGFALIFR